MRTPTTFLSSGLRVRITMALASFPARFGARRVVVLHLWQDEEVDDTHHAREDGAEEEEGREGITSGESGWKALREDLQKFLAVGTRSG